MPFQITNPDQLSLSDLVISQISNPSDIKSIKTLVRLSCITHAEIAELLLRTMLLMQKSGQLSNTPTVTSIVTPLAMDVMDATTTTIKPEHEKEKENEKENDPIFCFTPHARLPKATSASTYASSSSASASSTLSSPFTVLSSPFSVVFDYHQHSENMTNLTILLASSPYLVSHAEKFLDKLLYKLGVIPMAGAETGAEPGAQPGAQPAIVVGGGGGLGLGGLSGLGGIGGLSRENETSELSGLEGTGVGDMFAPEEEVLAGLQGVMIRVERVLCGVERGLERRRRRGGGGMKKEEVLGGFKKEEGILGGLKKEEVLGGFKKEGVLGEFKKEEVKSELGMEMGGAYGLGLMGMGEGIGLGMDGAYGTGMEVSHGIGMEGGHGMGLEGSHGIGMEGGFGVGFAVAGAPTMDMGMGLGRVL